jgi:hypothetical protein
MRRLIGETYIKLSAKLGEPSELSLRKQFCLQYLKWGFSTQPEDKEEFVELAKLWRREKGRVGTYRTLLERKARKLFQQVRKHKALAPSREGAREHGLMQKEKGIGIHSPEQREWQRENNRRIKQIQIDKDLNAGTLEYIVHPPVGESFKIRNLSKFCRENGLDYRNMWKTMRVPGSKCKGWRAERYSDEWGNL